MMACSKQASKESAGSGKRTDYRQLLAPSKKSDLNCILNTLFPYLRKFIYVNLVIIPYMSVVGSVPQQLSLLYEFSSESKNASDYDTMVTTPELIVTDVDSHRRRGYSDTTHTHPGYLRILEKKGNDTYQYVPSSILTKVGLSTDWCDITGIPGSHGPAMRGTRKRGEFWQPDIDFVIAIKCTEWPALEWANRTRPSGWPSQALVTKIVSEGCHIVRKAHPTSSESDAEMEFRYSFSIAEVEICQELCAVQKHCFLLYRYALDTAAEGLSSECKLSSYYLKTIFWWLCEQKSPGDWTSDTLGERLVDLLEHLLKYLREANIPNYFMPENNMISHMSETDIQSLVKLVEDVRSDPVSYLVCSPHSLLHAYPPQVLFKPVMDILDCKDGVKKLETYVLTLQNAARFMSKHTLCCWGAIKVYMGKQSILLRRLGHQMSQSLLMSVLFFDSMQDPASMYLPVTKSLFDVWLLAYTSKFLVAQKEFSMAIPQLHQAVKLYQSLSQDEINYEFSITRKNLFEMLVTSYIQLGEKEKAKQVLSSYYEFRPKSEMEMEFLLLNLSNLGTYYY